MDLLERDAPRALINDTFKRVCAGEGAIVLVSGEAGIGKTAFVTDFAESQRPVGADPVGRLRPALYAAPARPDL